MMQTFSSSRSNALSPPAAVFSKRVALIRGRSSRSAAVVLWALLIDNVNKRVEKRPYVRFVRVHESN
jgi:hypothetical protein